MSCAGRKKVALITGGNAGIGLALAARLIQNDSGIHICLACRSIDKAQSSRHKLLESFPYADITILRIDVSSSTSVYEAADEIRKRYVHVDYLYLNAGIMPGTTVDWSNFWRQLFSSRCIHMFATGDGLLRQEDGTTSEGLKQIFATNLFGHFILVKELEPVMGGAEGPTQIIWTSSSNAKREAFQLDDIQHANGVEPYSSSKYASDVVSYAMNERLNKKGIYSHTTNPGLVLTNLTFGILPGWLWTILLPVMLLLRLLTANVTISPENGCEALIWLSRQRPETLDPQAKYYSQVSFTGQQYVTPQKVLNRRRHGDSSAQCSDTWRINYRNTFSRGGFTFVRPGANIFLEASNDIFLDRKTNMSTAGGFRLALRQFTISPALERFLSDGTDVAGISKYFTMNIDPHLASKTYEKLWKMESTFRLKCNRPKLID